MEHNLQLSKTMKIFDNFNSCRIFIMHYDQIILVNQLFNIMFIFVFIQIS